MKLNIIRVLNEIANENASMVILNDPDAFWNATAENDLHNAYDNYKQMIEYDNESAWDMIEWLDKHGQDYSHWHIKKVLSFDEWLKEEMKMRANYMVAA